MAGGMLGTISEHVLHAAVRRWDLPCNGSSPFVVPLSQADRKRLAAAARTRNMTAEALASMALGDYIEQLVAPDPEPPDPEPPSPEPPAEPPTLENTNGSFANPLADDDRDALAAAAQARGTTAAGTRAPDPGARDRGRAIRRGDR